MANAWQRQHYETEWAPDRDVGFRPEMRRWPAAIRLLSHDFREAAPAIEETEESVWSRVRNGILPANKRDVCRTGPESDNEPFVRYINASKDLRAWWASPDGWRAPREAPWYLAQEKSLGCPHVEPYELAQLRLPDDVSMDGDVVAFSAWAQGVTLKRMRKIAPWSDAEVSVIRGQQKLHRSPWFSLALAAPLMQPLSLSLPGLGMIDSGARMAVLLRHPYSADEAEVQAILQSPQYKIAYQLAIRARKGGKVVNPEGGWNVDEQKNVLGAGFRAGGRYIWGKGAAFSGVVDVYDWETGAYISSFSSLKEASESCGTNEERLNDAIRTGRRLCGKFWRRA